MEGKTGMAVEKNPGHPGPGRLSQFFRRGAGTPTIERPIGDIPVATTPTLEPETAIETGGGITHLRIPVVTEPGTPRTEEEKEEELTPSGKSRRIFLAGLAGVGVASVIETSPLLRSLVNPLFEKGLEALGLKEAPVPQIFDNRAERGLIGDNNIVTLSPTEVQGRFPEQIVAEGDNITFLFPFQPPEGGRIQYVRSSGLPELADPKAVPEADREKQAQAISRRQEIEKQGIRTRMTFALPNDTIIVAPVTGHIMIPKGRQDQFGGRSDMTQWGRLTYYNQEQDVTYVLWFVALGGAGVTDNLYPLLPLQDYKPGVESGTNWQRLPEVQQGQPMLRTTKDNQTVSLDIKAYKGKEIVPGSLTNNNLVFATPDFLTATDETGREKLVVMQD